MWWVRIKHQWEFQRFSSLTLRVFLCDVVQLSYFSVPWYRMSGGRFMLDSRFLPLRVWSFTILPLVICPSMLNRGAIYEFLLVWIIHYWVDIKFAYRMCLILEKILIRNWGYYKPCTMGNPGCCEELVCDFFMWFSHAYWLMCWSQRSGCLSCAMHITSLIENYCCFSEIKQAYKQDYW